MKSGIYIKSLGAGSSTSVTAAVDPGVDVPVTKEGMENLGVFWIDCKVSEMAGKRATSSESAERLWKMSEEMVGEKFAW